MEPRLCEKLVAVELAITHLVALSENVTLVSRGNLRLFEVLGVELRVQDLDFLVNLLLHPSQDASY